MPKSDRLRNGGVRASLIVAGCAAALMLASASLPAGAAAPSADGASTGGAGDDGQTSSSPRPDPAGVPQSKPVAVVGIEPDGLSCFLGGVSNGAFVGPDGLSDVLRDGQPYRLLNLSGARGSAESIGLPVHEGSDGECVDLWRQELSIDRRLLGAEMLAFTAEAGTAAANTGVEVLDAPLPGHVELLKRFLSRRQIADPDPQFDQVIRADLQGDGTPEYILNVVRIGKESAQAGDHSLLLVVRGETLSARVFIVQDEVTVEDSAFPSTLWRNTVVGVLDVDGDGVSEIVTNGQYIYGGGWEVIRFDGSGFEHVLFCGCDG